jgi:hypothetical protein
MERTQNIGGCLIGISVLCICGFLGLIVLDGNGSRTFPLFLDWVFGVVGIIMAVGALIGCVLGIPLFIVGWIGTSVSDAGGRVSSSSSSDSLTEYIRRAGMNAAWVTSEGEIHHMSFSSAVGHVTSTGEVSLDGRHVGHIRSDGIVERDGIGPVLTVNADGSITRGGSFFATARPAMNRIHAGAGALALLIYTAAA